MATAPVETKFVTLDELMKLGSDAFVEVVDGEIVEMSPVGGTHHFIGGNIHDPLKASAQANDLGYVFMDGLIYLLSQKGKHLRGARVPDVSFIRKESIPKDWNVDLPFPGAPTLAVEIMSPDDDAEEVLKKVREYLAAGSEQVWVVFPKEREVHQYRQGDPQVRTYRGDEPMDVEALFPGLTLTLAQIFAVPKFK